MKKWLKRIGFGIAALIVIAIAVGAVTEQFARRHAAKEFPAPGKLVDIGGRRIQIDCRGSGSPVVVFESGLDPHGSLSWTSVQDEVAKTTRACSYSRAGIMWSDSADDIRDDTAIAHDLHAVLERAGERPPFVLVGHSLGGPYVVAYTKYFGSEVVGLVLVDPSHPDQKRRAWEITNRDPTAMPTAVKIMAMLSWTGLMRLGDVPPKDAPMEIRATAAYNSMSIAAMRKELEAIDKTFADVGASHDLGTRPLYVLTAMKPYDEEFLRGAQLSPAQGKAYQAAWKDMSDDEATWSTASHHLLIDDSGHEIPSEKPAMVIQAVRSVVETVRSGEASRP